MYEFELCLCKSYCVDAWSHRISFIRIYHSIQSNLFPSFRLNIFNLLSTVPLFILFRCINTKIELKFVDISSAIYCFALHIHFKPFPFFIFYDSLSFFRLVCLIFCMRTHRKMCFGIWWFSCATTMNLVTLISQRTTIYGYNFSKSGWIIIH